MTVNAFKSNGPVAGRYILGRDPDHPENAESYYFPDSPFYQPTSLRAGEVQSRSPASKTLFHSEEESNENDQGSGACFWPSLRAMKRRSIPGTRSRSGPPIAATRGCRCQAGTAGCSIWKKPPASKDYCDEFAGVARENGVEVTELSTHLQGQLVAVHPAYDEAFDGFAAPEVRGNPGAPGLGGRSGQDGADRQPQPGHHRPCDLFGRAGLALCLSLAAAPGGSGRDRL
jgi:hypothetical protein